MQAWRIDFAGAFAVTLRFALLLRSIFLAIMSMAACTALHAEEEECLAGIWRGTVGSRDVTFEFRSGQVGMVGRYHYGNRLADLMLTLDPASGQWKETDAGDRPTGRLRLACHEGVLTGTWSAAVGNASLAVRAVPADDYGRDRVEAVRPRVLLRGAIGSRHVETLAWPGVSTVTALRLLGDDPGLPKINAELLSQFKSDVAQAIDCQFTGRLLQGWDREDGYRAGVRVSAWNTEIVAIARSVNGQCGLHPTFDESGVTYDVRTGLPERTGDWLKIPSEQAIPADSALGALLAERYRRDSGAGDLQECLERLSFSGRSVLPAPGGLMFLPSAARPEIAMACGAPVVLPYKTVWPHLSPRGRERLKSFL